MTIKIETDKRGGKAKEGFFSVVPLLFAKECCKGAMLDYGTIRNGHVSWGKVLSQGAQSNRNGKRLMKLNLMNQLQGPISNGPPSVSLWVGHNAMTK